MLNMLDKSGPETAIQHLSQWDFGDKTPDAALVNGYVYDEVTQSATDRGVSDEAAGYALTHHEYLGYVSRLGHFDPLVEDARKRVAR